MAIPTVRVEDPDTKQIVTIPATELAPGMIRVKVEGRGEFFADASTLNAEGEPRHPQFPEQIRAAVSAIRDAFADVRPLSSDEWERGFYCDLRPVREICGWLQMAVAYRHFTRHLQPGPAELEKKQDVFQVILACVNNGPQHALATASAPTLSRKRIVQLVRAFSDPLSWLDQARNYPEVVGLMELYLELAPQREKD
jgi:hypothetical protein